MIDMRSYRAAADADASLRVQVPQREGPEGPVEPSGDATPATPLTQVYHDPHPPFETDGRGRVVWSNSSQQFRSRSSPPVQLRKTSNDETNVTRDKENDGTTGAVIYSNANCAGDSVCCDKETGVGGAATEIP